MKKRLIMSSLLVLSTSAVVAQDAQPSSQQQVRQAQQKSLPSPSTAETFPASTGSQPSSQQKIQAAFPPTNYGAGNYKVQGQQNGIAPMPPLDPPNNVKQAETAISPFSDQEIVKLRKQLDGSRKAKAFRPIRTIPTTSSISVDLSSGNSIPIARTLPGEMTTIVFLDSTGAPWPLAAIPRVSDKRFFQAEWIEGTPSVVISALSAYEVGNITVFLKGLATPVVVKLATGEPDSNKATRIVDYRLDLRVPGRGPNAQAPLLGPDKIALYDDTMQAFLDGTPPAKAKLLKPHGEVPLHTKVWQYGSTLFLRTSLDIQTAFDQSMASADGTHVYRLAPTPYVTLSDMGHSITLQLDID